MQLYIGSETVFIKCLSSACLSLRRIGYLSSLLKSLLDHILYVGNDSWPKTLGFWPCVRKLLTYMVSIDFVNFIANSVFFFMWAYFYSFQCFVCISHNMFKTHQSFLIRKYFLQSSSNSKSSKLNSSTRWLQVTQN